MKAKTDGDIRFDAWMENVDAAVDVLSGVSVHDLPDCMFRDWFDDRVSFVSAAKRALKAAGFPF